MRNLPAFSVVEEDPSVKERLKQMVSERMSVQYLPLDKNVADVLGFSVW